MMRIGLLTSNSLSKFKLSTLEPILEDDFFSIKVAMIDDRPKESNMQKLKKNIKRGRGGFILIMALQSISPKKEISINTIEFCKNNGIDVIKTNNPYSSESIENLRKYELDIILLVNGYGIIKEPLLSLAPLGILSYHHGNMRKFRGMPPAFWELYNNEKEMGVTVQILASGIDCGTPIEEMIIEIKRNDNLKSLQNRANQESANMMYQALKKLANPDIIPQKIENFGEVYTLPNLRQWITLKLKVMRRRFL